MNDLILSSIYEHLYRGATTRDDDFHIMTFCNSGEKGLEARSVVLRSFDKDNNILFFHTDYRSPKVDMIKKNAESLCLFYSFSLKTQLRIRTISSIHHNDDISNTSWEKVGLSSRKCYLTKYSPSSKIETCDDGLPKELKGKNPSLKESEEGKKNFCVVSNKIIEIDYLYLKSSGHERVAFDVSSGNFNWIAP